MRLLGISLAVVSLLLAGCVSPAEMRQKQFVELQNGESVYRFWVYFDNQVKGRADQLCPRGWREIKPRESGKEDLHAVGSNVFVSYQRIWITISCPLDHAT